MTASPRSGTLLAGLVAVAIGMVGLTYAAVPLYRLFCQVTGFGGTVQKAEDTITPTILERTVTVRFNADTDPNLPWDFTPDQPQVRIKIGEKKLISYTAHNRTDHPISGQAVFNVTPHKAGAYFMKIACFCFEEQTLEPNQTVHMPVSFYIDPKITEDKNLREVETITLSYTFFSLEK